MTVALDLDDRKLLMLLDFDGTLVPIAATPDAVRVPVELPELLRRFQARGDDVWIVTGRPVAFVRERLGEAGAPEVPVVGLHGLQWPDEPDPERSAAIDPGVRKARELSARYPGMLVEDKRLSLGLHLRQVPADLHDEGWAAARALADGIAAEDPSLNVLEGHEVIEVRPKVASKAAAVRRLATDPSRRVLYVGDDTTDEEAFAALPADGVAVRVGPPTVSTIAPHRLPDVPAVYAMLATLADR